MGVRPSKLNNLYAPYLLRRVGMFRLFLVVSVFLLISGCSTYKPKQVDNVCSIFLGEIDWYKSAKSAQKRWGTPIHISMAIMKQESTFRAKVRPKRPTFFFIPLPRNHPPMVMLRHKTPLGMITVKILVTGAMIAMILVML